MSERQPWIDGARVFAVGFILAWHGLLAFTHRERGVKADLSSDQLEVLAWLTRGFAIKILYVLAGLLAHQQILKRGTLPFLRRRLLRLLLPCAAAMLIYNGLLYWRWSVSLAISPLAVARFHLERGDYYSLLAPMHLWFLLDLALMTTFMGWVHRSLGPAAEPAYARFFHGLPPWSGRLALVVATAGLLGLHEPRIAELRYPDLLGSQPTYPVTSALGTHFLFFLVGWMGLEGRLERLCQPWPWMLLLAPGLRLLSAYLQLKGAAPAMAVHLIQAGYWWCIVLGILGCFQAGLRRPHKTLSHLAEAGYWCYLSHLLFMGELQYLVNGRGWPIAAQYAFVLGGTVVLCLTTFRFLVRPLLSRTDPQGRDLR